MGCHGHYYQQAIHQADQLNHEVEIRIESVQDSSQSSHPRIVASMPELWPYFSIALTWPDDAPLPTQGDRWQVKTRTKPPHDYANPASFNYRRYLLSHGIIATGYVQSATLIKASSGTGLQTWRDDRADKLQAYDNSALLAALTLGLRNGMTQAQWQVFAQTGTSHLMAISGLHLGMAFSWFWILFSFLGRMSHKLGWSRKGLAIVWPWWMAGCCCAIYAVVSGLSLPTLRALLFIGLGCWYKTFNVNFSIWRLIWSVAALLLLLMPAQAYSTSFWLSFLAVAAVMVGLKLAQGWRWLGWRRLILIQLVILVSMLPLQAAVFGQQSGLAPFINLIIIPWLAMGILPCALLGVMTLSLAPLLSHGLLLLADLQLSAAMAMLLRLSQQTWQLAHPDTTMAFLILVVIALTGLAWLSRLRFRTVWLLLWPCLLLVDMYRHYQPYFTLDLLDVGQGQAMIIRKGTMTLVYDVGPAYPSGFNMADAVLHPYFYQQGIQDIQALVLSHSDMDHAGSAPFLSENFAIHARYQPVPSTEYTACRQGMRLQWHGLSGIFVSPRVLSGNDNNDSCVLKLMDGDASILLTGDISKEQEMTLIRELGPKDMLYASLMVVPHHGSASSSSETFIQTVKPDVALVSSGFRNRWRFPKSNVLDRFSRLQIPVYNTADLGMIRAQWSQNAWQIKGLCDLTWPVWYRCQDQSGKQ